MCWCGSDVCKQTRARLQQLGMRNRELSALRDIDRPEDLTRLEAMLPLPVVPSLR